MNWYEEYIEKPVRDLVNLLRNNGFNTTCSCGHNMKVDCDPMIDGEIKRLHDLLYENGYINYVINLTINCIGGCVHSNISIEIN